MHHAFGIAFVVAAIGFAFGERTARAVVGIALIACAAGITYIAVLVMTGAI